jgi:serine/threonine protein kinase
VEEQIELSKAHWSVLAESASIAEEDKSEYLTALASEPVHLTKSLSLLSAVEEQIKRSKAHWSTLADQSGCMESEEEEEAEVSNVQVFLALQRHPSWGGFFQTFGYELDGGIYRSMGELDGGIYRSMGELEVG